MAPAKAMLDERHPDLPTNPKDNNNYILGRIYVHNVVIACLPSGVYGANSAATVATQMLYTFGSIRFGLMVGIGGGVPSEAADIRLGDVVVSKPTSDFGGVVQYDFGRTVSGGRFERAGMLNKPPQVLLTAVARLQADHMVEASRISDLLSEMVATYPLMRAKFMDRGPEQDRLFESTYDHKESQNNTCDDCDTSRLVTRPARVGHSPVIHYGLIASANEVMRHGGTRDKLAKELGILCFEMEAAGLMDNFPCLVIRGICDYADSHKNKLWQEYAAATAAAYTKELLSVIPVLQVADTPVVSSTSKVRSVDNAINTVR
jgi:nucleoside phosphorylase